MKNETRENDTLRAVTPNTAPKAFNWDQDLYLPVNCTGKPSDVVRERGLSNLSRDWLICEIATGDLTSFTDVLILNPIKGGSNFATEDIRKGVQQYIWDNLEDFIEPGSVELGWTPEFANASGFRESITDYLIEEMSFGPDGERLRGHAA